LANDGQRKQLFWRDFYAMQCYYGLLESPVKWPSSSTNFNLWSRGETGFPVIDAAMKQLRKEGRMINRLRLLVANFLVKDLLIDWRHGAKWFETYLEDIDYANNIGNWLWVASVGHDSQPYFRTFDPIAVVTEKTKVKPWIYSELVVYLKKWLKDKFQVTKEGCTYSLPPIVDHHAATERWLEWWTKSVK
jgi:deoxyribodipyrimidine photo-lyase